MIEIIYKSIAQIDKNLKITINNIEVDYTVDKNKIIITNEILFGLNLLKINSDLTNDQSLEFTTALINGTDLRQAFYLSFSESDNKKFNNTILNKTVSNWILPFGNPVSWWICECNRLIGNSNFGKNLYENNMIYYPESIVLDSGYSNLNCEFFKYNFGFSIHNKTELLHPFNNKTVPYIQLTNFKYDAEGILDEFIANTESFDHSPYSPIQNSYTRDKKKISVPWQILGARNGESREFLKNFPLISNLVKRLENDNVKVLVIFLSKVHAKSTVDPHADKTLIINDVTEYKSGCCEIFLPIGWDSDSYFKFDRVGLIPHNNGAYLLNNVDIVHASVNNSNKTRYTIGFMCEFPENFNKYL